VQDPPQPFQQSYPQKKPRASNSISHTLWTNRLTVNLLLQVAQSQDL